MAFHPAVLKHLHWTRICIYTKAGWKDSAREWVSWELTTPRWLLNLTYFAFSETLKKNNMVFFGRTMEWRIVTHSYDPSMRVQAGGPRMKTSLECRGISLKTKQNWTRDVLVGKGTSLASPRMTWTQSLGHGWKERTDSKLSADF